MSYYFAGAFDKREDLPCWTTVAADLRPGDCIASDTVIALDVTKSSESSHYVWRMDSDGEWSSHSCCITSVGTAAMHPQTLLETVKRASVDRDTYPLERTMQSVLLSAAAELGECAEEVNIVAGHSYKNPDVDGIVGEALDVIACMLDLIHVCDPTLSERDLIKRCAPKMTKWLNKVRQFSEGK